MVCVVGVDACFWFWSTLAQVCGVIYGLIFIIKPPINPLREIKSFLKEKHVLEQTKEIPIGGIGWNPNLNVKYVNFCFMWIGFLVPIIILSYLIVLSMSMLLPITLLIISLSFIGLVILPFILAYIQDLDIFESE